MITYFNLHAQLNHVQDSSAGLSYKIDQHIYLVGGIYARWLPVAKCHRCCSYTNPHILCVCVCVCVCCVRVRTFRPLSFKSYFHIYFHKMSWLAFLHYADHTEMTMLHTYPHSADCIQFPCLSACKRFKCHCLADKIPRVCYLPDLICFCIYEDSNVRFHLILTFCGRMNRQQYCCVGNFCMSTFLMIVLFGRVCYTCIFYARAYVCAQMHAYMQPPARCYWMQN